MSFLRRPEIWVLLVIAAAAAYFALRPTALEPPPPGAEISPSKLTIDALVLTRDHGNAELDITFTYDNRDGTEVVMAPPGVVLRAGDFDVPPFFLVGSFPDPLPAGRVARNTAKYWLEPEHFSLPLTFVVQGDAVPLKSAAAFDLTTLENGSPVNLAPGNW
jgi:hypothetical protein